MSKPVIARYIRGHILPFDLSHVLTSSVCLFFLLCSPHSKDPSSRSCCPRSSDCRPGVCSLPAVSLGILCLPQPQGPGARRGRGPSSPPPSGAQRRGPLNGPPLHNCWNNAEGPHLWHDNLRLWIRYDAAPQGPGVPGQSGQTVCVWFWIERNNISTPTWKETVWYLQL